MKKLVKLAVTLALLVSITPIGASATSGSNVNVKVNGSMVSFPDAKPYVDSSNSRTMVPVRFVGEKLGAIVAWNDKTKTVTMAKDKKVIILPVGEKKATVDGKQITFDAAAIIKDNRTFVPLRFISESFGADVDWLTKERLVVITTGDGAGAGNGTGVSGTTPTTGTTPTNGTSPTAEIGEKVGAEDQFTVVAPSYPDMLLPRDSVTEPAMDSFVESLHYENGTLSGKIPTLPKGHVFGLIYVDYSNKSMNKNLTGTKEGESFLVKVGSKGGKLSFVIYKGNEGKNEVYVTIPQMQVEWGAKR
ncbi:copper amine oxidase N-terminal domain-containing protein [Brevibacillus migulae]|uniref:copper amine oxidase N-terminal domain-containing protein n=1 Tax=Brevibacillus migulae TaxID=1644114 RepID=UPI00106DDA3B|nr:copper amine oxidase N-terminal domain-containing protein [Brevibacillus migulae]